MVSLVLVLKASADGDRVMADEGMVGRVTGALEDKTLRIKTLEIKPLEIKALEDKVLEDQDSGAEILDSKALEDKPLQGAALTNLSLDVQNCQIDF